MFIRILKEYKFYLPFSAAVVASNVFIPNPNYLSQVLSGISAVLITSVVTGLYLATARGMKQDDKIQALTKDTPTMPDYKELYIKRYIDVLAYADTVRETSPDVLKTQCLDALEPTLKMYEDILVEDGAATWEHSIDRDEVIFDLNADYSPKYPNLPKRVRPGVSA